MSINKTDGRSKYPTLTKLVKNILIISHGNADVEHGFSINENIVNSNRSLLSETSFNGLRTTYDAISGFVHKACIHLIGFVKLCSNGWRRINYTIRILNITLILSSRPGHLFKLKGGS